MEEINNIHKQTEIKYVEQFDILLNLQKTLNDIDNEHQKLKDKYQELKDKSNKISNIINNAIRKGRKTVTIKDFNGCIS